MRTAAADSLRAKFLSDSVYRSGASTEGTMFFWRCAGFEVTVRLTTPIPSTEPSRTISLKQILESSVKIPYFFVEIEAANRPQIVHASFRGFRQPSSIVEFCRYQ